MPLTDTASSDSPRIIAIDRLTIPGDAPIWLALGDRNFRQAIWPRTISNMCERSLWAISSDEPSATGISRCGRAGPLYGIESRRGATITVKENDYPLPVIHRVDREMATIHDMLKTMPLASIEIVIEGKDRDQMTPEELAHDTRETASFPTTREGLKQARRALLKRTFEIWKAEPEHASLRCPFCRAVFPTTLELLNADRCPACGELFGDEDAWLYPVEE